MTEPKKAEANEVLRFLGGPADGKFLHLKVTGEVNTVQWDTSMYLRDGMLLIWQKDARA